MTMRSMTETIDGAARITDHAACDGCGTVLHELWLPPERTINKRLVDEGWYKGALPGTVFCPRCGAVEAELASGADVG